MCLFQKEHLKDGDDVYVHFRKGVPLGLFAGGKLGSSIPLFGSLNHKSEKAKRKGEIQAFVKMKRTKTLSKSPFNEVANTEEPKGRKICTRRSNK